MGVPQPAAVAALFLQEPRAVRSDRQPMSVPVREHSILEAIAKLGSDEKSSAASRESESTSVTVAADAKAAYRGVGAADGAGVDAPAPAAVSMTAPPADAAVADAGELSKLLATIGDAEQAVGPRCSAAARLLHLISEDPYTKERGTATAALCPR
jgi:hypothetical protein